NHAVVAMVGPDVKQTRCTTCDTEHEYKHAKVPRQRRKQDAPAALYSQVLAGGPKRVAHDSGADDEANGTEPREVASQPPAAAPEAPPEPAAAAPAKKPDASTEAETDSDDAAVEPEIEEGPVHRPLIRATLPRAGGQPPPPRPAPDFTIRHPGGRPNRFRPQPGRGGQQFHGNRSNGNMGGGGIPRSGGPRPGGGRPPGGPSRLSRRHGPKRQK